MPENTNIKEKKSANHFHIDEGTVSNIALIKQVLLPKDIKLKDVDIIRSTIKYMGEEIALRHPGDVEPYIYNIKQGAFDGFRVRFIRAGGLPVNNAQQAVTLAEPVTIPPVVAHLDIEAATYDANDEKDMYDDKLYTVGLNGMDIRAIQKFQSLHPGTGNMRDTISTLLSKGLRATIQAIEEEKKFLARKEFT